MQRDDRAILESRWDIVAATANALARGGASLQNVPGLIKRLIGEETWREYVTPLGIETFQDFAAFIVHPRGLATTIDLVERICGGDMDALDLLDKATMRKDGRPEKITNDDAGETVYNVNSSNERARPMGNSRGYALRRLRTHRPDIHARVLTGELSPHRGMIEAGFLRQPTPLDELRRAWKKASDDERVQFFQQLPESEQDVLFTVRAADRCTKAGLKN
jgi:hypothetical protein